MRRGGLPVQRRVTHPGNNRAPGVGWLRWSRFSGSAVAPNAVPAPPIIEIQRSYTSDFIKTLGRPQPPVGGPKLMYMCSSSSAKLLIVPHHNLSLDSRAFRISALTTWNSLPQNVLILAWRRRFINHLLTYLLIYLLKVNTMSERQHKSSTTALLKQSCNCTSKASCSFLSSDFPL